MARYLLEELSKQSSRVGTSYVNCFENSSRFRVLYEIVSEIGMPLTVLSKGTPTDEVLEKLRSLVEDRGWSFILADFFLGPISEPNPEWEAKYQISIRQHSGVRANLDVSLFYYSDGDHLARYLAIGTERKKGKLFDIAVDFMKEHQTSQSIQEFVKSDPEITILGLRDLDK